MDRTSNQFSTKVRGPLMYIDPHSPPVAHGYLGRAQAINDGVRKQLAE